jgi:hypothetical protein
MAREMPTPSELKKSLLAQGFEIYRTSPDQIALADRVRDNLLMDAGVSVRIAELAVRLVLRAQAGDFPGEGAEQLYERVRGLGVAATERGYREVGCGAVPVQDPGDRSRTLDTWYEVTLERSVPSEDELADELRYALGVEKTVQRR